MIKFLCGRYAAEDHELRTAGVFVVLLAIVDAGANLVGCQENHETTHRQRQRESLSVGTTVCTTMGNRACGTVTKYLSVAPRSKGWKGRRAWSWSMYTTLSSPCEADRAREKRFGEGWKTRRKMLQRDCPSPFSKERWPFDFPTLGTTLASRLDTPHPAPVYSCVEHSLETSKP